MLRALCPLSCFVEVVINKSVRGSRPAANTGVYNKFIYLSTLSHMRKRLAPHVKKTAIKGPTSLIWRERKKETPLQSHCTHTQFAFAIEYGNMLMHWLFLYGSVHSSSPKVAQLQRNSCGWRCEDVGGRPTLFFFQKLTRVWTQTRERCAAERCPPPTTLPLVPTRPLVPTLPRTTVPPPLLFEQLSD